MPIGAAMIGVAGGVANGFIGMSSARSAAAQQQAGAAEALQFQKKMYGDTQDALRPFNKIGAGAMKSLGSLYGIDARGNFNQSNAMNPEAIEAFKRSPDYAFAQQEGIRGLGFSNSATGLLGSSEHLRSATQFSSGLATQNFQNYQNALKGMAGYGLDAGKALGTAATNFGQMGTGSIMAGANAGAAGEIGAGNALMGGINSASNALMGYSSYMRNNSAYGNTNPNVPGGTGDPARYGNLPAVTTPDMNGGIWAGL